MPLINIQDLPQITAVNLLSDPGHIAGPVVIPNAAKMIIRWGLTSGKVGHNVIGLSVPTSWTATVAEAEAARAALVAGANWTAYAGFLATGTTLAGVDLLDIRSASNPLVSSSGTSTPGTSVSLAIPSEVAAALTIRTNKTGPQNRGRVYLPGFATNALAAGDLIAAAAMTAISNFITNMHLAWQATGATAWVILQPARAAYTSPRTGRQFPARAATFIGQSSVSLRDNHWDSQRRRGLK